MSKGKSAGIDFMIRPVLRNRLPSAVRSRLWHCHGCQGSTAEGGYSLFEIHRFTGNPAEASCRLAIPIPKSMILLLLFFLSASPLSLPGASGAAFGGPQDEERFRSLREVMVRDQIAQPRDYREPVRDQRVLDAMRSVPRHLFVAPPDLSRAYADHPLPIGHGQTISQPYIVALMTEMLQVEPGHRVLEVGTGSGYQAAILSLITSEVYTVEVIEALALPAAERLRILGYNRVKVKAGDGYYGWEEHAPFDRILVTCAATLVPPPLLQQLRPGGKMCIPVGAQYAVQVLTMVEKAENGSVRMRKTLPVRFVPFIMPAGKQ
jgi:protein-L-isoaspartate(D-aspartate) O-methyltransferase